MTSPLAPARLRGDGSNPVVRLPTTDQIDRAQRTADELRREELHRDYVSRTELRRSVKRALLSIAIIVVTVLVAAWFGLPK